MPFEKFSVLSTPDETLRSWQRKLEYLFNKNLDDDNVTSSSLTLGTAQVKASNIDFGTGANQVDASDIPTIDASSYFVGANVELNLQQLGSTILNLPAENVKVVDAGSYFISTSVEGVLQEIGSTLLNISSTNIGEISSTKVTIVDVGGYYVSGNVEAALQEIGYLITNTTANITLASSNQGYIICDATIGITVTLPAITGNTKLWYSIRNINTGTVTIDPATTDLIDGTTSFDLYQDESLSLINTGLQWREG